MSKCQICGNYPSDQEATIYGYHRKKFFKVKLNICHMCGDLVFSYWDSMNGVANRYRLLKHEMEEATLTEVMSKFTGSRGKESVLEDSLSKFLRRIGYLIKVSKSDVERILKEGSG